MTRPHTIALTLALALMSCMPADARTPVDVTASAKAPTVSVRRRSPRVERCVETPVVVPLCG